MTDDPFAELRKKYYNATIVYLKRVNEDLMIVRVEPDFPVPPHKAGQYGTLGMGQWEPRYPGCQEETPRPGDETKLIRRAYSISSSIIDEQGNLLDLPHVNWL